MRHKLSASKNIGIEIDPKVIDKWKYAGENICELVEANAIEYIRNYCFGGAELIYADPPYPKETRRKERIYKHDYTTEEHIALLDTLKEIPCMVMISSYENEIYNEKLAGWRKAKFNAKTHYGVREECVWMNFPAPTLLHDSRYMGESFRERQTIKRRQERLRSRIRTMSSSERGDLVRWIEANYKAQEGGKNANLSRVFEECNN